MSISVIIAAHNCENYIRECLDSIIQQTFKDIEIIVCDDNSTDDTYAILQEYAHVNKIILLRNQVNQGAAFSRNRCLKIASGEFIAIQDADDYSDLTRLEIQYSYLAKNDSIDFVSTGLIKFNSQGLYDECRPKIQCPTKKDFVKSLPFMHATTIFKKDILLKVGGYRIAWETRRGQDYDLFMRIYALGGCGINLDKVLYFYRYDQMSKNKRKYKFRVGESIIRYKGFKNMGILHIGFPYIIKPLIVGLMPDKSVLKLFR